MEQQHWQQGNEGNIVFLLLQALTFDRIMESQVAREYFENFLKRDDNESLMGYV